MSNEILLIKHNKQELKGIAKEMISDYANFDNALHMPSGRCFAPKKGFFDYPKITQEGYNLIQILDDNTCADPFCRVKAAFIVGLAAHNCDQNISDYPPEMQLFKRFTNVKKKIITSVACQTEN
ncbi:Oidioi.mRNA.OKI2018_I69.chr1.g1349.t1.cds [Oikopleura dioica]|uniref:Oidioi.mRNA.OKI2018_I69.chr1.g1349.t1.cds n=1 Tax=Oikopleura dioica TaxID=34765 RepID=A0ABN7SMM7_OIKDI|nr:Oidioi.mRNA.OKI2018_I69.chr1.g1349.t1.cds [Oikopleura dioica]